MDRYTQRAHNKSLTFAAEKSERISFAKQSTYSSSSESTSTLNRVRRDRSMIIRAERLTDKDGKQTEIVHMDCKRNTAKCISIVCNVYDVQPKAQVLINVTARLWNSTLVSDYPSVDLVKIASIARIKVFEVEQEHPVDTVVVSFDEFTSFYVKSNNKSLIPGGNACVSGAAGPGGRRMDPDLAHYSSDRGRPACAGAAHLHSVEVWILQAAKAGSNIKRELGEKQRKQTVPLTIYYRDVFLRMSTSKVIYNLKFPVSCSSLPRSQKYHHPLHEL